MMRSLWAGVTGLQAHQIAMDVEGNNIANVNTTGFKYSRANFSDLLNQTAKIATAPQGELGGKNSMQIGLGTQVSSVTKMFKQGSIQTTDKNTDLAISGDGFFVISPDGGNTYKYTRNGDFTFDANGNFVDANGYIAQGWLKNDETGEIDSTAPIRNITIPPGLTTPANDTGYITLKANLNSGDTTKNKSAIYSLDQYKGWYDKDTNNIKSTTEIHDENDTSLNTFNTDNDLVERGVDMGVLFDATGKAFNLREGQGLWVSYSDAISKQANIQSNGSTSLSISLNGVSISGSLTAAAIAGSPTADENALRATEIANLINAKTSDTGVVATVENGNNLILKNTNKLGTDEQHKNINLIVTSPAGTGLTTTNIITAYQYVYSNSSATTNSVYDAGTARKFHTTEDLRATMQTDARSYVNYTGVAVTDGADAGTDCITEWRTVVAPATTSAQAQNKNDGVEITVNSEGKYIIKNPKGDAFNVDDDTDTGAIMGAYNNAISGTDITAILSAQSILFPSGSQILQNFVPSADIIINGTTYLAGSTVTAPITLSADVTLPQGTTFSGAAAAAVDVTTSGITYKSYNTDLDDQPMYISVTGLTNASGGISENLNFTTAFSALQGSLPSGTAERATQNIYMASHASSIDVFDSLGSKHTVRFEFRKTGQTDNGGTEWSMLITVPEPGQINFSAGNLPQNIITGSISFNSDGSLATFSPTNLTYTANNGSTPNQNIELHFGTLGQFDGMTSFDKESNTSGISQDGYPGGDLSGIRVDETGTLIGSFTNGRSFGLAQVAMAKFTNNEGLESDGGNTFIQTSNSGDPVIGQASVGGRGAVQASSLEMSNVDLSRSLTQLIVIQRGYQANSKTITTSDEMLNTLLQLK
ncbi:flagellar hook-basal body complex protein [Sulfurospirillum sp. MES]|uniref:flagellar hook-basal body complex protein n=1 Tax=Sulfurospirillum sp. MES TaxID=1565314 RepID=UPI000541A033|nr:flagellar hook-basal body complex protein [Sulfurospirillum sp. MES]KHG34609.1 MAG: flagellar hook protein FlgE [Sulfurospirillum sp. MES]